MAINGGNYSYPLDPTWTAEELIAVTNFYRVVEDAYETGAAATGPRLLPSV